MPQGVVVRALSGFYDVADGSAVRRCRARGVFRKRGVTVLVGDRVKYDAIGLSEGVVTEVLPRSTELVRPPVANIDQALMVFSLHSPSFHSHLLDRALVAATSANLRPVVIVTKCDLGTEADLEAAGKPYEAAGYTVVPVSVKQTMGVDEVRRVMSGYVNVFVGPSGAGKSTLGNALSPELGLKMGEISEKLGRGKHTTRHVELFSLGDNTYIADAPGFSQLELTIPADDLRNYFPEFQEWASKCAYRGCQHLQEEDCGVRRAVEEGVIFTSRYESYRLLMQELRHKEETRY